MRAIHERERDHTTPPDDLIGLAEACKLIPSRRPGKRIHLATVYRWVLSGKVRGWRIGRNLFVSRKEIVGLAAPVEVASDPAWEGRRERREREEFTRRVHEEHGTM